MDRQIKWVQIAGVRIPAHKLICPECRTMDLNTAIDKEWNAHCADGHSWKIRSFDREAGG